MNNFFVGLWVCIAGISAISVLVVIIAEGLSQVLSLLPF